MEQETESRIDYYILFRDATVPTPFNRKERNKQREVLLTDEATYVWGYVGELGESQAKSVQKCLVLEFKKECVGNPEPSTVTRVITYNAVEQLAFIKNRCVIDIKENLEKRHGSFVALISLETLMAMWRRFGYCQPMNLLRRTMEIWVVKVLEAHKIFTSEQKLSPEDTETEFKSTILDEETYIPTLTLRQLEVLGKCVDIVNSIRTPGSFGEECFVNKYKEAMKGIAPEYDVEQSKTVAGQGDVLDLLEKLEGRWVSQKDFLNKNINANRGKCPKQLLEQYRKKGSVVWSKKNKRLGWDQGGNFLKRTGKKKCGFRYRYFLLKEFDKQSLSHVSNAGIDSTPQPLKENVAAASKPVTGTSRNVASAPIQPTAKGKPSRPAGKKYPVPKKDTPKTASVNDSKSDSEPVGMEKPKQTRRNTPARVEDVKKIIETYWKKVINGELVTQKDVALLKFPNEPNILSKKVAKSYMKKISDAVKIAKAKHKSIRNFDNGTRATLLTYVRDTLEG